MGQAAQAGTNPSYSTPSYLSQGYLPSLPAGYLPQGQLGSILSIAFSISVLLLILFLILVFIHFVMFPIFSLSPDDNGLIPVPIPSDRQLVFTQGAAQSDLSANVINIPPCTYSLGMDIYVSGDFQAASIPRVLLYRSTVAGGVKPPTAIERWSGGVKEINTNLRSMFPDTNLIIWLDPTNNYLFASIVTSNDGTATNTKIETTKAVENIPIRKVFRLTVVFTQQFIELYVNGTLERSMALKSRPLTVASGANFYPVIPTIGGNVRIANLAFWPRILSAREARAYGMPIAADTFFNPVRSSS